MWIAVGLPIEAELKVHLSSHKKKKEVKTIARSVTDGGMSPQKAVTSQTLMEAGNGSA